MVKSILGAVAMMHIPVNNHHPFQLVNLPRMLSGHDCVAKDTEAHGSVFSGMMTWWTQQCIGIPYFTLHYCADGIHGTTSRVEGGLE